MAEPEPTTEMRELPVAQITPDPEQPRTESDGAGLQELALSIQRDGLIEPLVVRPTFPKWTLIAGERRWRAAKLAGVERVPCLIRWDVDADRAFELALAENLLREHLTPLEEAAAFRRLMTRYGLSLLEAAARVEKGAAYLEFRLRLLNLRVEYQDALKRKILSLPQAADLARVPAEQQPVVFRLYQQGRDANEVARVVTAMLEREAQTELPVDAGEARQASDRFR